MKEKKGEKRYYVKKAKKGPMVKFANLEEYKPPKIRGCRIT